MSGAGRGDTASADDRQQPLDNWGWASGWKIRRPRGEGQWRAAMAATAAMPGDAWLFQQECLEVVPRGLEPRTLRLLAVRSDQLSYETL